MTTVSMQEKSNNGVWYESNGETVIYGVVTSLSLVETFTNKIKMDQGSFWDEIQAAKINGSMRY